MKPTPCDHCGDTGPERQFLFVAGRTLRLCGLCAIGELRRFVGSMTPLEARAWYHRVMNLDRGNYGPD